jgi:hypothetical protein
MPKDTEVKDEQPEEPVEEPTPEEPTPEEEQESEEEVAGEPGEAPQEEEATEGEQTRALGMALDRERKLHAKRLGAILGDNATETMLCPLCGDGLMGYLHPGSVFELTDENREAALAFLGAPAPGHLKPAEGVVECSRCDGWGQLEYPTKVEHVQTQSCPRCAGQGYVNAEQTADSRVEHAISQLAAPPQAANGAGACPTCGQPGMAGQPHYCQPVAV